MKPLDVCPRNITQFSVDAAINNSNLWDNIGITTFPFSAHIFLQSIFLCFQTGQICCCLVGRPDAIQSIDARSATNYRLFLLLVLLLLSFSGFISFTNVVDFFFHPFLAFLAVGMQSLQLPESELLKFGIQK